MRLAPADSGFGHKMDCVVFASDTKFRTAAREDTSLTSVSESCDPQWKGRRPKRSGPRDLDTLRFAPALNAYVGPSSS